MAILKGAQKRVLTDVIKYFVDTTGGTPDDYLRIITSDEPSENTYSEWLAKSSLAVLTKHGITAEDCVENKDTVSLSTREDEVRQGGEFYTPEVWCREGREVLARVAGKRWGTSVVWDTSCGTGNLMLSSDYDKSKVYMSTLIEDDVKLAAQRNPGVNVFQLDFVNELDYDEYNMNFSKKLPDDIRKAMENNEPIIFYMNPPYKVMKSDASDVGAYMSSMGLTACAKDIFNQFLYRILMLKRMYNLTNVYMGVFGPPTLYHSLMLKPLFDEFKKDFVFNEGFAFRSDSFSNTSDNVNWVVVYTAWSVKGADDKDKSIVLDVKEPDELGGVKVVGSRLMTDAGQKRMHKWSQPTDDIDAVLMPELKSHFNFTGNNVRFPVGSIAAMMSDAYVIRGMRRAAVLTLPCVDVVPVTPENFMRSVASFAARRVYGSKSNPYNNCQFWMQPDETVEGYDQWIADAIVLFLCDNSSNTVSYRNDGVSCHIDYPNPMFPVSYARAKELVTDEKILADMQKFAPRNEFFLNKIEEYRSKFSPEAEELFSFYVDVLEKSLSGDVRKQSGYQHWTHAWDAGYAQIRPISSIVTSEIDAKYISLGSKLKDKMYNGVYKYGFLMDYAFYGEEGDTYGAE